MAKVMHMFGGRYVTSILKQLVRSRRGAAAMSFVLMLPVLLAGLGMAVDYASFRVTRSQMQSAADTGALAGASTVNDGVSDPVNEAMKIVASNTPAGFGQMTKASDVIIGTYDPSTGFVAGAGPNANAVQVTALRSSARGNPVIRLFSAFLLSTPPTVSVSAIAAKPTRINYEPPALTNLDSEAGDYNELYAYCFNQDGTGTAASNRSQMTLMSNNMPAGQNIVNISKNVIKVNPPAAADLIWPKCDAKGQTLSFRLRNVRHAKSMTNLWASPNTAPGRPEYNYYTDTVVTAGKENFKGLGTAATSKIVETVRCDTLNACNTNLTNGQLVTTDNVNINTNAKNRTPKLSALGCEPGKFMYFGWEDRPPGQTGASGSWTDPAWTDKDYNDIVVVMKCPRSGTLGDGSVRLVG